ncbi:MAG TPA: hypothetical protein VNW73_00285 [Ktedonobacteraceae bacterium]|nr:hypothetical protein [Ktedonobacteraceae bacterium]
MASNIDTAEFAPPTGNEKAQAVSSLRFDWIMVVVSIWWLGGLFIDGWAHSNIPQLETFFTPWHAVFYSGYLAVAFTLLVQILLNLRKSAISAGGSTPSLVTLVRESLPDNRWLRAIPTGYELSVLGLVIFGVSGIGDLTWHLILGIERSTEALLSPTHLGLAMGIGLALSGPLRAAWHRSETTPSWRQLGPAILSLTFTFSLLTFFTAYASPLVTPWPIINASSSPTRGITDILLITALSMSFVLLALRRWRLPFGTFAFMFGLNGALMVVFSPDSLLVSVPTALLGGLAADLLYRFLQPSLDQPASVRLFAFLVPAMFYTLYLVDLAIVGPIMFQSGILWSAPFWAGTPVIAGITGFLLSFVILPPALPAEQRNKPVI